MTLLRRFIVLVALMFWQGGFTFYVSVVVPIGTEVLHSALRQGFITRQVTFWLNVAGAITLSILAAEMLLGRFAAFRQRWAAVSCWLVMTVCQGVLFWMHRELDGMMQVRGMRIEDPDLFYQLHRVYLWAHTVQWFAGLVLLILLLRSWRYQDGLRTAGVSRELDGEPSRT